MFSYISSALDYFNLSPRKRIQSTFERYIKEYFISYDLLDLSIKTGELNIKNLIPKDTILNFIPLPLKLIEGRIDKLHASLDFRKLLSEPLSIDIEELSLTVGLLSDEIEEESVKSKIHFAKMAIIQYQLDRENFLKDFVDDALGKDWISRLKERMIYNLSVNLKNIHIKFVDSYSTLNKGSGFSLELDICLDKFVISNEIIQVSKHSDVTKGIFNKSIELNKLQLSLKYSNPNTQSSSPSESNCEYVVFGPLNFKIVLKINNSGNISEANPEYKMDCGFEALTLCLDIKHYHILLMELHKMNSLQEKYSDINILMMEKKKISVEECEKYKTLKKNDLLEKFLTPEEKDFLFNFECNYNSVNLLQIFKNILNETGKRPSEPFESVPSTYNVEDLNNSNDDLSQSSNDQLSVSSSMTSLNQREYYKFVCNFAIKNVTIKILECVDFDQPLLTFEVRSLQSNISKKIYSGECLKILNSIKEINITGRINSLNQSYEILKICDFEGLEEEFFTGSIIFNYIINYPICGSPETHIHSIFSNITVGLNYKFIEYLIPILAKSSTETMNLFGDYLAEKIDIIKSNASEYLKSDSPPIHYTISILKPRLYICTTKNVTFLVQFNKIVYKTILSNSNIPCIADWGNKYDAVNCLEIDHIVLQIISSSNYFPCLNNESYLSNLHKNRIMKPISFSFYIMNYPKKDIKDKNIYKNFMLIQINEEIAFNINIAYLVMIKHLFEDSIHLLNVQAIQAKHSEDSIKTILKDVKESNINMKDQDLQASDKITEIPINHDQMIDNTGNIKPENSNNYRILFNLNQFSVKIKWHLFIQEDNSYSSKHNLQSQLYLSIKEFHVDYFLNDFDFLFDCKIKYVIFCHTFDDTTFCILQSDRLLDFTYDTCPSKELTLSDSDVSKSEEKLGTLKSKSSTKSYKSNISGKFYDIKMYLHYCSVETLLYFSELVYLTSEEYLPAVFPLESKTITNEKDDLDQANLNNFECDNLDCVLLYNNKPFLLIKSHSFVLCTKLMDNVLEINTSLKDFSINDLSDDAILYKEIFKVSSEQIMTLNIKYSFLNDSSSTNDGYNLIVGVVVSKIKGVLLYKWIKALKFWSICISGRNTAIKQVKNVTYDTASSKITSIVRTNNKIKISFDVYDSDFLIPINSKCSNLGCLSIKKLHGETILTFGNLDQYITSNLNFLDTVFSRSYNASISNERVKILDIETFNIDSSYIIKNEKSNQQQFLSNCITNNISGSITPEDIIFMKNFILDNFSETSFIELDISSKNKYEIFAPAIPYIYEVGDEIKIKDFPTLTFEMKTVNIDIEFLFQEKKEIKNKLLYYYEENTDRINYKSLIRLNLKQIDLKYEQYSDSILLINLMNVHISNLINSSQYSNILLAQEIAIYNDSRSTVKLYVKDYLLVSEIDLFYYIYEYSFLVIASSENYNNINSTIDKKIETTTNNTKEFLNIPMSIKTVQDKYSSECRLYLKNDIINIIYEYSASSSKLELKSTNISIQYDIDLKEDKINSVEIAKIDELCLEINSRYNVLENIKLIIPNFSVRFSVDSYKVVMCSINDVSNCFASSNDTNCSNQKDFPSSYIRGYTWDPFPVDASYSSWFQSKNNSRYLPIHEKVFARNSKGEYNWGTLLQKSRNTCTVKLDECETDLTLSLADSLAVIIKPAIAKNISIGDIVLACRSPSTSNCFWLAEVIENSITGSSGKTLNSKILLRYFFNYSVEVAKSSNLYLIPKQNYSYRGVGDYLFCRYIDGSYRHAIVLKRGKSKIRYGIIDENGNINKVIDHKISDISSFALLTDRVALKDISINNDHILAISSDNNRIRGNIAYVYFDLISKKYITNYFDPKFESKNIIAYLKVFQQQFGYNGLGYRYFKVEYNLSTSRSIILPFVNKFNSDVSNSKIKEFDIDTNTDSLFVDAVPNKEMLFIDQTVIVICSDHNINENRIGKIKSISSLSSDEYYIIVLLSNSETVKCNIKSIRINEKDLLNSQNKQTTSSLIKQKASLNIDFISISFIGNMDSSTKPLLHLSSSIKLELKDWSIHETEMLACLSIDFMYFNSRSNAWEPFLNFDNDNKSKDTKKNIKIRYVDTFFEKSLYDGKDWIFSNNSQYYSFKILFKNLLRISLTEMSLGAIYLFYLSLNYSQANTNAPISEQKFQFFNDLNEDMELIPGNYFEDTSKIRFPPNFPISLTESVIKRFDKTNNEILHVPFVYLKFIKYSMGQIIFLGRNKSFLIHLQSSSGQRKIVIVEVYVTHGIHNVYIRNLFKIHNHLNQMVMAKLDVENGISIKSILSHNEIRSLYLPEGIRKILFSVSRENEQVGFNVVDINRSNLPFDSIYKCTSTGVTQNNTKQIQIRVRFSINSSVVIPSYIKSKYDIQPIIVDIYPCLRISNQTIYDIEISSSNLFESDETVIIEKDKEDGEIFNISFERKKYLFIKINNLNGIGWVSDPIDVSKFVINKKFIAVFNPMAKVKDLCDIKFILEYGKEEGHITIYSPYYVYNNTAITAYIHLLSDSNANEKPIEFLSKSKVPFCPSPIFTKAKISVENSKVSKEEFLLNVVSTNIDISCCVMELNTSYYFLTVSILQSEKACSINIEIGESICFVNSLDNAISIAPKNMNSIGFICLEVGKKAYLKTPIPNLPCEFDFIPDISNSHERIPFTLYIDKTTILNTSNQNDKIAICPNVDNSSKVITFCRVTPNTYQNIFINFTKLKIYYHERKLNKVTILPKHQIYFNMEVEKDSNKIDPLFYFSDNLDNPVNIICANGDILSVFFNDSEFFVFSFHDTFHRVYVLTNDYDLALFCVNMDEENLLIDCDIRFKEIELSLINTYSSKELAILLLNRSRNLWSYYNNMGLIENIFTSTDEIEKSYVAYKKNNQKELYKLDSNKIINFPAMLLQTDKTFIFIRRIKRYGFRMKLCIGSSYNIQKFAILIDCVKIDNPCYASINRIILRPTQPSPSVAIKLIERNRNFFMFSIILNSSKSKGNDVNNFIYIDFLKFIIQEFNINLDVPFILSIASYLDSVNSYIIEAKNRFFPMNNETSTTISKSNQVLYKLKYAHFSPLKIHASFKMGSSVDNKTQDEHPSDKKSNKFYHFIFNFFSLVPILNFNDIKFDIPCREIKDQSQSTDFSTIITEARNHYITELQYRSLSIIFGLNIIGNPMSSVSKLAFGVKNFFYEPSLGSMYEGDSLKGLSIGFNSLIYGTVGNAATIFSNLTESVGSGLAALSFDKKHQFERNAAHSARSTNPSQNFIDSSVGVIKGISSGIAGIVLSPIDAYKESKDPVNVIKGVGKGFMGLITKPLGGVVDFASSSFNLISKATDIHEIERNLRDERCFYYTQILTKYNPIDSEKYKNFIKIITTNLFLSNDMFVSLFERKDGVIILTDTSIIIADNTNFFNIDHFKIYPYYFIKNVQRKDRSILLCLKKLNKEFNITFEMPKEEELLNFVTIIKKFTDY